MEQQHNTPTTVPPIGPPQPPPGQINYQDPVMMQSLMRGFPQTPDNMASFQMAQAQAVLNAAAILQQASTNPMFHAALFNSHVNQALQNQPVLQQEIKRTFVHLREDRDSGNESSPMSSSPSISRSPSHTSRSNSFSQSVKPYNISQLLANEPKQHKDVLMEETESEKEESKEVLHQTPTAPVVAATANYPQMMAPMRPQMLTPLMAHHLPLIKGPIMPLPPGMMNVVEMENNFKKSLKEYYAAYSYPPNPDPALRLGGREACAICSDNASGYHYGVMSCEGCKGFFRRTIQKNIDYQCHKSKSCMVDRISRNRCQFCRYEKCIKAGMNKDQVRLQDRKGRKKSKEEEAVELEETKNDLHRIKHVQDAFVDAFPADFKADSLESALARVHFFLSKTGVFNDITLEVLARKAEASLRGILLLRAAYANAESSLLNALEPNCKEKIDKLRSNLRIWVRREELALLCAMHAAQCVAEDDKCFNDLSRSLRIITGAESPEKNSYERLVLKLGLLQ